MAFVYWIKLKTDTNLLEDGYVGVTVKTVAKRFSEHLRSTGRGSDLCVHRALRKHCCGVEVVTLLEGSEEYCYLMESRLRPRPGVGWNMNAGGNDAPRTGVKLPENVREKLRHNNLGKTLSESWRLAMSLASKGRKKSPEHARAISAALKGKPKSSTAVERMRTALKDYNATRGSWEHTKANKGAWARAEALYEHLCDNLSCGSLKLATKFGLSKSDVATIHREVRAGWNPHEDQNYQGWLSTYRSVNES